MTNTPFQSEHFTLHQLAGGVYAAIATELGAGFSNAGLIDLGEQTLVFDAFENPLAAEDLLQASLHLTGRNPSTVILSHWHPDHWGGLQVFKDSSILATPETRTAMIPLCVEMLKDRQDPSRMEQALRETEAQLAVETEPIKRHTLQVSIARQRHDLAALPALEPTLSNQTFAGKIIFHGSERTVELMATGKGHTLSDCILRLPQERVAFIGDLGFFQSQPFMPYGFPAKWVKLLNEMAGWDIDTFVPGHGPLGSKADLVREAEYILALETLVAQVVQAGGSVEDALRQHLPAPFAAWQTIGHRFEANVRASFMKQSMTKRKKRNG
jgi:glyoxylase-like metal-dependent hydrolase (beta-lactamase superfamily II)